MSTELLISFPDESLDEAGSNIADLKEHLAMVAAGIETHQRRADPNAQDMGATLAIVLAAPAVVAVAKGIADWLKMRAAKPKLVIRNKEGQSILELDNMSTGDVRALLEGKIGDAVGQ